MHISHFYFNVLFFNDTATTEIYTLSLHDALPILHVTVRPSRRPPVEVQVWLWLEIVPPSHPKSSVAQIASSSACLLDRKSTRLNSSHANISYAVFCLKKKYIKKKNQLHSIQ